jgi:hypothetical protein
MADPTASERAATILAALDEQVRRFGCIFSVPNYQEAVDFLAASRETKRAA